MSRKAGPPSAEAASHHAATFAALGDVTRLQLIGQLSGGKSRSIVELTRGIDLTRQAVTKHLKVLESVGLVRCVRKGRLQLFDFTPSPLEDARKYLDAVSQQWGDALNRLKTFLEQDFPTDS